MGIEGRRFGVALAALTLLGVLVRAPGIDRQPPTTDEVQSAFTADGYVNGGQTLPTMPHHPNLRNLLVAASLRIFGGGGLGLRFFSLAFGVLAVPLLALIVRRLAGGAFPALGAAFLLAVDPLHVAFSRQSFQETHVVFFSLLGVWLSLGHLRDDEAGGTPSPISLPAVGAAFGLALASKFQAAFPLMVVAAVVVYRALRARDVGRLAMALVCLTVVPITVLALVDAPWFGRGYDLADWSFMRRAVFDRMSASYVPAAAELNPDRSAWLWFVKPLAGYASFSVAGGRPAVSVGLGNPLVWLLVLPAAALAAWRSELRSRTGLLQAFFWASYLPFLLTTRPIFFLTAMAPAPFAFALVSVVASELASAKRRAWLAAYGLAILMASLMLLPLAQGTALNYAHGRALVRHFNPHVVLPSGSP